MFSSLQHDYSCSTGSAPSGVTFVAGSVRGAVSLLGTVGRILGPATRWLKSHNVDRCPTASSEIHLRLNALSGLVPFLRPTVRPIEVSCRVQVLDDDARAFRGGAPQGGPAGVTRFPAGSRLTSPAGRTTRTRHPGPARAMVCGCSSVG
jgi:hypothetical protein